MILSLISLARQFRYILWVLFIGLALTACGGNGYIVIPPVPPAATLAEKQAYLVAQIDATLNTQQDALQPGVSIIVKKDNVVVYSRSKGMADINLGIPITANTAFEIASVTKPITAIAVMQLMERRLLSLNDSVLKWLPQLPPTWHGITIHHLLAHQSGIPDYLSDIPIELLGTIDGLDNLELFRRFTENDTLLFAPGTNAKYSSSNYAILAEVISQAATIPYAQYLQENIFAPLGMRSTFVYGNALPVGTSAALNFARDKKIFARETKSKGITIALIGPIGINSSAMDLDALVTGLRAGKLVSMETLRMMTSPQSGFKVIDTSDEFYGYGWFVPPLGSGLGIFSHWGDMDGYRSILLVNYEKGVDTIVLSNGDDATKRILDTVRAIVQEAYQ